MDALLRSTGRLDWIGLQLQIVETLVVSRECFVQLRMPNKTRTSATMSITCIVVPRPAIQTTASKVFDLKPKSESPGESLMLGQITQRFVEELKDTHATIRLSRFYQIRRLVFSNMPGPPQSQITF